MAKSIPIKRLWINLSLLMVVIGLGLMVTYLKSNPTPAFLALLPQSRAEINQIRIERAEPKMMLVLQRQAATQEWQIMKPSPAKADPIRVKQLLSLIDEQVVAEYTADVVLLARFGLTPDKAIRLQFNDEVLWLGQENPVSRLRYVLQDGTIKLVAESVYRLIEEGENAFSATL